MKTLPELRVALIGGGNMGRGLVGGLLARGLPAGHITVADINLAGLQAIANDYGVQITTDNSAAVAAADVVVLAVKPQQMAAVLGAMRDALAAAAPVLVSVAAGLRVADLARWSPPGIAIVRAMPNRPALISAGASGLYADATVGAASRALAELVLQATGVTVWVDRESDIDLVTALSGSGPAYFFLLAELMAEAAVARGLPADTARVLAAQTLAGAGQLVAAEATPDLARMRAEVTSPGGTTAAALAAFAAQGLGATVVAAMEAAEHRSRELADLFGAG
jgi:pyrroline-5-carboxylate reductase